jgi:hypothetical protein
VELVLGLYPPPDVDNVQLYSDDSLWTEFAEALAPAGLGSRRCHSLSSTRAARVIAVARGPSDAGY